MEKNSKDCKCKQKGGECQCDKTSKQKCNGNCDCKRNE